MIFLYSCKIAFLLSHCATFESTQWPSYSYLDLEDITDYPISLSEIILHRIIKTGGQ